MKVFFIRHAEGYHNLSKEGHDILYPDLTEKGIDQAYNLGMMLNLIKFDKIIVSPLKRTLKTAELAFGKKNFLINEDIREYIGHNCDFRETKQELENMFPYVNFDILIESNINQLENDNDVDKRMSNFFNWLSENNKYQNIAIVSHGGFLNRFFRKYHAELDIKYFDFLPNCGVRVCDL